MLKVKNLLCTRNDKVLFRNVSFSLQPGQALKIGGPNGVGKTTLLRTIAGLIRPTFGKIELDNSNLCYIGHKASLHPDLTILQNLQFLSALLATDTDTNTNLDSITQALAYFKMQTKINHKFADLSMGQAQRVNLARLCFCNAKIWLLDEPLANLDQTASDLLLALCLQHLQNHGIIIFASHHAVDLKNNSHHTLQLDQCQ